jgi:broad specificity phosphatase PhoE
VSTIYFIRHGQAGTRDHYDVLSELGEEQARLLGQHLSMRGFELEAVVAGELRRQQHTARIALDELGGRAPSIMTDDRWNEFDLKQVYEFIAPRLVEEAPAFRKDFELMQAEVAIDAHTVRGAAGRCDRAVIEAWMANRFPGEAENSWGAFRHRVERSFAALPAQNLAVFSSVTPIAICLGRVLELSNEKILRLMAVMYNTSITVLKIRFGEPLLFHFNTTPHLSEERMLTFR